MKRLPIYGAVLAVSLALFWFAPGIDLFVSGLFYDPQHGFVLAAWPPLRALQGSILWVTWANLIIVAIGAAWLRLVGRPLWRLDRNALIFLVAALAIGPGILVNTVLKDHWGRARPHQIEAFGGSHQFTPRAASGRSVYAQLLFRLGPCGGRFLAGRLCLPHARGTVA